MRNKITAVCITMTAWFVHDRLTVYVCMCTGTRTVHPVRHQRWELYSGNHCQNCNKMSIKYLPENLILCFYFTKINDLMYAIVIITTEMGLLSFFGRHCHLYIQIHVLRTVHIHAEHVWMYCTLESSERMNVPYLAETVRCRDEIIVKLTQNCP